MNAETLNCPNCGAAISCDSPRCRFCESKLATVACPSCFGMMFIGNRHCPHCGTLAAAHTTGALAILKCPRCKVDMLSKELGGFAMRECESCGGLWLEVAEFEKICADREQQSSVLGAALRAPAPLQYQAAAEVKVQYLPCPQCGQLMNRMNFARFSGVVLDVCRGHGTWFDRDELRRIIDFMRSGGIELSREKEKRELALERERLAGLRSLDAQGFSGARYQSVHVFSDAELFDGVSAARGLLKFLIE
jgi:Zn-finger nucleic acid-binding protein